MAEAAKRMVIFYSGSGAIQPERHLPTPNIMMTFFEIGRVNGGGR